MGRQIDNASNRQKVATLDVGGTVTFPLEKYDYVTSMAYRVGLAYKRKYTCAINGGTVTVTRVA